MAKQMQGFSTGTPRPRQMAGSAPAVSGTAQVGQELTCDPGVWTGPALTYAYQWIRDASTTIDGATNATYTLQAADQTHTVKCTVTVTAGSADFGSYSATSPSTGTVIAA